MQIKTTRRTHQERTDSTKASLVTAARRLFNEKGYANTGTPEIVEAAQVTRGALYHHFTDKADLFHAVALQCAQEVADSVDTAPDDPDRPVDALVRGAQAYFDAMSQEGRARLLLLEAPSVLTVEQRKGATKGLGRSTARRIGSGSILAGTDVPGISRV